MLPLRISSKSVTGSPWPLRRAAQIPLREFFGREREEPVQLKAL